MLRFKFWRWHLKPLHNWEQDPGVDLGQVDGTGVHKLVHGVTQEAHDAQ
jgi:hypothetical protein